MEKNQMEDRQAWLAERRKIVSGTDIAAICGIDPYRGPMDVFLEKHGLKDDFAETEAMKWGKILEDPVAQEYARQQKVELLPGEFLKREWRGGTPDRMIKGQPIGLEIKTTNFRQAHLWGDPGSDEVPEGYYMQCAWYMSLFDVNFWDIAVLIDGKDFRVYHLTRNQKLEKQIIEIGHDFYQQHMLKDDPPQIDGSEGCSKYLKRFYPQDIRPDMVPSNRDLDDMAMKLKRAIAEQKELEDLIADYQNKLKAVIGDSQGIAGQEWRATWKKAKDSIVTDWKAVAIKLGATDELIKSCSQAREGSRRFLLKFSDKE
jgi:putative phage-type endonuclease